MLDLEVLHGDYAICRLAAKAVLPATLAPAIAAGAVVSVTWTPDEVSILCPADLVPDEATVETPWRCLRVAGPVDLALTGILASLVAPLADARVNIFAFSTYETDYLLVPAVRLRAAILALNAAGHRVTA
jgi:hypothetical protein